MSYKLRTVLICLAGAGLFAHAYAGPSTGAVHITGKLSDSSCVLDSASTSSVNLPSVNKDLLSAAQSSTGRGSVALKVTGCPDGLKVSAAFVPDGNVDAYGNLRNTVSGGTRADNVQVQLLDKDFNPINIHTDNARSQLDRAITARGTTPVTLQYYVQYYSQEGSAGNGDVAATANYQLTYE
ncbi:MAG: fimbrial protein [Acidaminococcaceae bacterium]